MLHNASDFSDVESEAIALEDLDLAPRKQRPEHLTFELPSGIWIAMIGCYAVLMLSLLVTTGFTLRAGMMIGISAVYISVFFGVSTVINGLSGNIGRAGRRKDADGSLQTLTGKLSAGSVAVQVLVVPAAFAVLGIAFAIIRYFAFA